MNHKTGGSDEANARVLRASLAVVALIVLHPAAQI
jgi:hypothetical protein